MLSELTHFLLSALVIVVAGAALTQFGDIISDRTRLGGLMVGSILIAGATSLPELAIDVHAVRIGSPDLAAGDLLGSSLFNLLILAVLDLTRYSHGTIFSRRAGGHALAGGVSIILTGIVGAFILVSSQVELPTFARVGPGSVVLVIAYALGIRLVFQGQRTARKPEPAAEGGGAAGPTGWFGRLGLKGAIAGYVVAAVVILVAAPFLARSADALAERSGLGGTFFGTTFVALCTSLPEIVTTFSAVRMKSFDLAIGNIFGSNCFNMLIFAALDVAEPGSLFAVVAPTHAYTALGVTVVTMVVVLGQLYHVERKKPLLEPDALMTIVLIGAVLAGLYWL